MSLAPRLLPRYPHPTRSRGCQGGNWGISAPSPLVQGRFEHKQQLKPHFHSSKVLLGWVCARAELPWAQSILSTSHLGTPILSQAPKDPPVLEIHAFCACSPQRSWGAPSGGSCWTGAPPWVVVLLAGAARAGLGCCQQRCRRVPGAASTRGFNPNPSLPPVLLLPPPTPSSPTSHPQPSRRCSATKASS